MRLLYQTIIRASFLAALLWPGISAFAANPASASPHLDPEQEEALSFLSTSNEFQAEMDGFKAKVKNAALESDKVGVIAELKKHLEDQMQAEPKLYKNKIVKLKARRYYGALLPLFGVNTKNIASKCKQFFNADDMAESIQMSEYKLPEKIYFEDLFSELCKEAKPGDNE